jgi:hypothetical protein
MARFSVRDGVEQQAAHRTADGNLRCAWDEVAEDAQIHIRAGLSASFQRFTAYLEHYETQGPFWHLPPEAGGNQPRFACSNTPNHSKMNQSCTEI